MAVVAPTPSVSEMILQALHERNARVELCRSVVSEYGELLRNNRELEVRCAQLDKEAAELRDENNDLRRQVEAHGHVDAAEVAELRKENAVLLRTKADLLDDKIKASTAADELQRRVDDLTSQLNQATARIGELEGVNKELQHSVDNERAACAAAADESEQRLVKLEAAEREVDRLRGESRELELRLLAMNKEVVDKMNEVNDLYKEVEDKKKEIDALIAAAGTTSGSGQPGVVGGLLARFGSWNNSGHGGSDAARAAALPETLMLRVQAHSGCCNSVCFSPSGASIATCGDDMLVKVWDSNEGRETGVMRGMTAAVHDVAFTCDSDRIVAAGADKSVRLWDGTGRLRHTMNGHTGKVVSVDCSAQDNNRAVSGGEDRCIKLWDLHRGYVQRSMMCSSKVHCLRYTLDTHTVVSGHYDGALRVWDTRSGKMVLEMTDPPPHTQTITGLAAAQREPFIVSCGKDNLVKIIDPHRKEVKRTLRDAAFVVGWQWCTPAISANDGAVAVGGLSGEVLVWDATSCAVVKRLSTDRTGSTAIACSWNRRPQGNAALLAACNRHGALFLWK